MAKIKEIYIWIVFFVLVIAGAVYLRYYYQPSLQLSVSFVGNGNNSFYPYQQVSTPILVQNTGSSEIANLSFGLYVNNNLTRTYKMTIPTGKQVTVYYNFSPSTSGTYRISMVADPDNLYNIQNRKSAQADLSVNVEQTQTAQPQSLFSSNGLLGEDEYNLTAQGFALSLYLFNDTGANQYSLTQSEELNNFVYPTLDVYYSYIKDIVIGHAYYKNYSIVSIWLKGYLTPSALDTIAVGKGFNVLTENNVTVIDFGGNTTMCSWYSGGWLKSLGVVNGTSCTKLINGSNYEAVNSLPSRAFVYKNSSIYNYSGFFDNYSYIGQWSVLNSSFIFQSVEKGSNFTNVCYGSIVEFANISYCNTYYLESGNTILVKTNALLGSYNFSTWEVAKNLNYSNQTNTDTQLIKRYNLTGNNPSATFVSGFVNSCFISDQVGCIDSYWNYSKLELGMMNDYNSSIHLDSIACFISGTPIYTQINKTLLPQQDIYIETPCYQNDTAISGVPLGLSVYLDLRLTALNGSVIAADGDAKLTN